MNPSPLVLLLVSAAAGAASTTDALPAVAGAAATLEATPLADNTLPGRDNVENLHFVVGSDHGRTGRNVGAELQVCKPRWGSDDDCTTLDYVFPGLTFDPATREVKWGGDVVEQHGDWLWTHHASPAFRLGYKVEPVEWTNGLDSGTRYAYAVYLQKLAAQ